MISTLLNMLLNKTRNQSITWGKGQEIDKYEYSYLSNIPLREGGQLKLELYYSDSKNKISNCILKGYNKNTKLFHINGSEYPVLRDICFALYIQQQKHLKRDLEMAIRAIGGMKGQPVDGFRITPGSKFKTRMKKYLNICLHHWLPYDNYKVCGICGKTETNVKP